MAKATQPCWTWLGWVARLIPASLAAYHLELSDDGRAVTYDYDTRGERTGITSLLSDLRDAGVRISDLDTSQSSLEDIFVSLVRAS